VTLSFALLNQPADPVSPRLGILSTAHGEVRTPAFMPVGTLAAVKSLLPSEVRATGAEILLVNAYHLYLRPGLETLERAGGAAAFMGWDGPVLSDSGGFQVFSLARIGRVDESGVTFRSHIDGSEHHYTPELAMEVQRALRVDIAMPLDHVLPGQADRRAAEDAAARTLRWFERSRRAAAGLPTFAIVQGGVHEDLRRRHARELAALDAPGYSIGGLSVGESKAEMWSTTEVVAAELPLDRPRYLMGIGSPEDLVEAVARGVDMFDSVLPTRLGRNGALFTPEGRVSARAARFREEPGPVDAACDCLMCSRFSMSYVHHLFRNDELLAYRLASIHNLRFLARLVEQMREAIALGTFDSFAQHFRARYRPTDEAIRSEQKERWLARGRVSDAP
jgi:queuine tRNA-ribosyltransferase